DARITIIERGGTLSYAACGLPFFIAGAVKDLRFLSDTPYGAARDAGFFAAVKDVAVLSHTDALRIERESKTVAVRNLKTGAADSVPYDLLVIATGASPAVPPIEGVNLKNVFTLHTPPDAAAILKAVESGAEKAVVIGGGMIGLEAADAFHNQAVDCAIVELREHLLPDVVDADVAAQLERRISEMGVAVHTCEKVVRLEGGGDGRVKKVVTDKRELTADLVLLSTGIRPNTALARDAALDVNPETGCIAVDDRLRTSDPSIFAGGDCVDCLHLVTGKRVFAPLGSTANKHGRVIGDNLTGGDSAFPGVAGTSVVRVLGMNVARTGVTEKQAADAGFNPVAALVPYTDLSHFFPGSRHIVVKLVVDADTRKVLGAQVYGAGDVSKRIDVVASAITFGAAVDRLANLDLAYAPPFSAAMDAVIHAANAARNKLDGLAAAVSAAKIREKLESGAPLRILDVRSPKEFESSRMKAPVVSHVPLDQLRARAGELPGDAGIVTVCPGGLRAYEAQRILNAAGFRDVAFMDGGMSAWLED
ncbi:MAG: FAD-dependent oxidoreductase, partial [bacterium]